MQCSSTNWAMNTYTGKCFELTVSRLMTLILTLTIFTCINFALFVVNVPTLGDEAWVVQSSGDDGSGVVDKFGTSDLYSGLLLGLAEVSDLGVGLTLGLLVDTVDNFLVVLALVLGLDVVLFMWTRRRGFLKRREGEQKVCFTQQQCRSKGLSLFMVSGCYHFA